MCCPECECGLDDNGDCACTIEYDSYDDQPDSNFDEDENPNENQEYDWT